MKVVIVIPARHASTRLPGKLLKPLAGKSIIQRTYERARGAVKASRVVIATDHIDIKSAAEAFGAEVVMTDPGLSSGSARVAEAAKTLDAEIIVNVQGDEPEIDPANIDRLIALQITLHEERAPFCSTLVCPFPAGVRPDDPAAVKAVLGRKIAFAEGAAHQALYFTRALAPYPRDARDPLTGEYHLHIGVYAFRRDSLQAFAAAPESRLETIERLEQLRILEMGGRIFAAVVSDAAPGIDTLTDYEASVARFGKPGFSG